MISSPPTHRRKLLGRVFVFRHRALNRLEQLIALILIWTAASSAVAFTAATPITPGASPEARALLAYFSSIYGTHIIAGQHDGGYVTNGLSRELNYIQKATGKLPAILEFDLSPYTRRHYDTNHVLMKRALDWAQNRHGIVALCWHWRAPMDSPEFYTKDTAFDISRAVTPGTPEYAATERDLDTIARELEILRDAHVPVLWRPLHEANGRWFWWGAHGPEPFKKLWRMMFENFTVKHHLNNLIWVFSAGAETDLANWYPGDAFVDILAYDHYPMDGNHKPAGDIFEELVKLTRGQKLVAFGENGPVPDPKLLVQEKAGWMFFITWSGNILFDKTTPDQLREYYSNPYVLTLTDWREWENASAPRTGRALKLGFCGAPGDVAVGGRWRMPVSVAVEDKEGRTVREGNYSVSLALTDAGAVILSGNLTVGTFNGVATFPGVSISGPVNGCRLVASANGLRRANSSRFNVGPGNGLLREWWAGATNSSSAPDNGEVLDKGLETPVAMATNFSARIFGDLIAPQSGQYRFWIAGVDEAELWLGTNAEPASKIKIAALTWKTPYQKWPHASEVVSEPVTLKAGRHYYFEMRQKQPHGSTQLLVGWRLPDGSEERPIPAFRFEHPVKADPRP